MSQPTMHVCPVCCGNAVPHQDAFRCNRCGRDFYARREELPRVELPVAGGWHTLTQGTSRAEEHGALDDIESGRSTYRRRQRRL